MLPEVDSFPEISPSCHNLSAESRFIAAIQRLPCVRETAGVSHLTTNQHKVVLRAITQTMDQAPDAAPGKPIADLTDEVGPKC